MSETAPNEQKEINLSAAVEAILFASGASAMRFVAVASSGMGTSSERIRPPSSTTSTITMSPFSSLATVLLPSCAPITWMALPPYISSPLLLSVISKANVRRAVFPSTVMVIVDVPVPMLLSSLYLMSRSSGRSALNLMYITPSSLMFPVEAYCPDRLP